MKLTRNRRLVIAGAVLALATLGCGLTAPASQPAATPTPATTSGTMLTPQVVVETVVIKETVEVEKVVIATPTEMPTPTPVLTSTVALGDEPAGWVGVEFEPAGDLRQVYNHNVDGRAGDVFLTWFNVELVDQNVSLDRCSLRVTTGPEGERVATNGAWRLFRFSGPYNKEELHALVTYWLGKLEVEPRGACAKAGAYSVSWQNPEYDPGLPGGRPEAAGPYGGTASVAAEWAEIPEKFHPTGGKTQRWTLNHEGDAHRLSIAWFWARRSDQPAPASGFTAVAFSGPGNVEVTAAGASRTWRWNGSAAPTEEQIQAQIDVWIAALEKETGGQKYVVTRIQ